MALVNTAHCSALVSLLIATIIASGFLLETGSNFAPSYVWSAVNKSLDEDRLCIFDGNGEKIRLDYCTKLILYNKESKKYLQRNHSGDAIFIDVTDPEFATDEVVDTVREKINATNPGIFVPCIVLISIVNVSEMQQEKEYGPNMLKQEMVQSLDRKTWVAAEKITQDYKFQLSMQFTKLLQFKTPMQARHLVLVRLTEKEKDLTKWRGKKYSEYPRRLVPIWEQVLFDHFKGARVIQGTLEQKDDEYILYTGKESGTWVWMCEEITRRLDLRDSCKLGKRAKRHDCQHLEASGNFTTAEVEMTRLEECKVYRPRT